MMDEKKIENSESEEMNECETHTSTIAGDTKVVFKAFQWLFFF